MRVNADFAASAFERTGDMEWVPSPTAGVERRMLDRVGDEVARATSLVRYAPASRFPEHTHGKGEEFLVLEGVFADEHGEYPAGTYVRNPPGSSHAPASAEGCVLLVKLRQFADDDLARVVVDTHHGAWEATGIEGVERLPLHAHRSERVALYRMASGSRVPAHEHPGGEEVFLIEGGLSDGEREYVCGDWLRLPPGSGHAVSSPAGAVFWVKTGHLPPSLEPDG